MKQFGGFPARTQYTPVPTVFITRLLPEIEDMAELKTTLHLFRLLYGQKGLRFVTREDLLADVALMGSLTKEALDEALAKAVARGTFLHLALTIGNRAHDAYFLNSENDRRSVARIQNGEMALSGLRAGQEAAAPDKMPDLFSLYEENIGMLTPLVSEELRQAEKAYPAGWIEDAIREAARQQVHKWAYVAAILERWAAEGRGSGAHRRNTRPDAEKYRTQKYGNVVER